MKAHRQQLTYRVIPTTAQKTTPRSGGCCNAQNVTVPRLIGDDGLAPGTSVNKLSRRGSRPASTRPACSDGSAVARTPTQCEWRSAQCVLSPRCVALPQAQAVATPGLQAPPTTRPRTTNDRPVKGMRRGDLHHRAGRQRAQHPVAIGVLPEQLGVGSRLLGQQVIRERRQLPVDLELLAAVVQGRCCRTALRRPAKGVAPPERCRRPDRADRRWRRCRGGETGICGLDAELDVGREDAAGVASQGLTQVHRCVQHDAVVVQPHPDHCKHLTGQEIVLPDLQALPLQVRVGRHPARRENSMGGLRA
jgi:hypothetical protein